MDLALTINGWIDEEIIFAQQLGARQVFAQVDNSQGALPNWDAQTLAGLANRIEKAGLVLAGLHAVATPTGVGGREEPQAWTARLIREAGLARIGVLNLSAALFPARRSAEMPLSTLLAPLAESAAQAGLKLVIPVALLKQHLGGRSQGGPLTPQRLLGFLPASAGLDGTPGLLLDWLKNAVPGSELHRQILARLVLISFENDRQPGSRAAGKPSGAGFDELLAACWHLRQNGYPGLIRLGQPSQWKGDTRESHQARAFSTGYLRAVLQAFQRAAPNR